MTASEWLARARDDLEAARALVDIDHPPAAVSRAYYAAFYAARAALDQIGEERSTHSGVISAFGRFVVREGGADPTAGRALNELFNVRTRSDYDLEPVSEAAARLALDRASAVVAAVEGWLAKRQ